MKVNVKPSRFNVQDEMWYKITAERIGNIGTATNYKGVQYLISS